MGKIYKGQGYLDIRLYTGIDISSGTSPQVIYEKPDGTTGYWSGTITDTYYVTTTLTDSSLDQAGNWKLQAKVTMGTVTAYGETINLRIHDLYA